MFCFFWMARRKEVSLSLLEALSNEIVAHVLRVAPEQDVAQKLEDMGASVGRRLAERLTRDKGRFATDLEVLLKGEKKNAFLKNA